MTHKKILHKALTIMLASLASCSVFHVSDNDDLDGFWMLTEIDTLATGSNCQMRQQRVFWSFQGKMMQTQMLTENPAETYIYRFLATDESLLVNQPCLYNRVDGDQPITEVEKLRPMGINALEIKFEIEQIDKKHMTLNDGQIRLRFEKY